MDNRADPGTNVAKVSSTVEFRKVIGDGSCVKVKKHEIFKLCFSFNAKEVLPSIFFLTNSIRVSNSKFDFPRKKSIN